MLWDRCVVSFVLLLFFAWTPWGVHAYILASFGCVYGPLDISRPEVRIKFSERLESFRSFIQVLTGCYLRLWYGPLMALDDAIIFVLKRPLYTVCIWVNYNVVLSVVSITCKLIMFEDLTTGYCVFHHRLTGENILVKILILDRKTER